jgi:hypothetical protein
MYIVSCWERTTDSQILRQVHTNFYDAFDARDYPEIYPLPLGCDVEVRTS